MRLRSDVLDWADPEPPSFSSEALLCRRREIDQARAPNPQDASADACYSAEPEEAFAAQ